LNIYVCVCISVKRDLILSFAHSDFRLEMAQDDNEPQRFTVEEEQTKTVQAF